MEAAATRGRKAPASVEARSEEAALLVLRAFGAAAAWSVGKAVLSPGGGGGGAGTGRGEGGRGMCHFLA